MGEDLFTTDQLRLLVDETNRAIVQEVRAASGPLDAEELAERLAHRDVAVVEASEYEARRRRTLISLHHDRLPRLAEAGLIDYDRERGRVERRAPRGALAEWQSAVSDDALRAGLAPSPAGEQNANVGVVEGHEAVVDYGRGLADEAAEELFCVYASTALLSDECIQRCERAIDRGVEMYLGSRNAEVRDRARRVLSGATIWEPQTDWLRRDDDARVGRLVLADRRRVMLAVLDDSGDERPTETAMVGEGRANPLVTLVRKLLGPRLDHLDFQSEDCGTRLQSHR